MNKNPNRYIHKNANVFKIEKYWKVDTRIHYFGSFHSLEIARKVRDFLESINWGFPPIDDMRHISYSKSKKLWIVNKTKGEEQVYYGSYHSLEEAQHERDVMEEANWDFELTNGNGVLTKEEKELGQKDMVTPTKGVYFEKLNDGKRWENYKEMTKPYYGQW